MSNFFESELRKLFSDGTIIRDPVSWAEPAWASKTETVR